MSKKEGAKAPKGSRKLELARVPRGESKEPKGGLWDPLGWPETTTKDGGVVVTC